MDWHAYCPIGASLNPEETMISDSRTLDGACAPKAFLQDPMVFLLGIGSVFIAIAVNG
jgi:hypothetical protein